MIKKIFYIFFFLAIINTKAAFPNIHYKIIRKSDNGSSFNYLKISFGPKKQVTPSQKIIYISSILGLAISGLIIYKLLSNGNQPKRSVSPEDIADLNSRYEKHKYKFRP